MLIKDSTVIVATITLGSILMVVFIVLFAIKARFRRVPDLSRHSHPSGKRRKRNQPVEVSSTMDITAQLLALREENDHVDSLGS